MTGSEIDGSRGFKSSPLQQPVSYLCLSLYSCRKVPRLANPARIRNLKKRTVDSTVFFYFSVVVVRWLIMRIRSNRRLDVPTQKIEHEPMGFTACGQSANHHESMRHLLDLVQFTGNTDFLERCRDRARFRRRSRLPSSLGVRGPG